MLLSKCCQRAAALPTAFLVRTIATTLPLPKHHVLPPRPTVDESTITESFLKGSGPGGQKINKTSSAVQLKHLPTGIVVKSQETRSRSQNRTIARRVLAEKLEQLEKGDESRAGLKAERAKVKKASSDKKKRRKYRKLEEGKEGENSDGEGEDGESVEMEGSNVDEAVGDLKGGKADDHSLGFSSDVGKAAPGSREGHQPP